ncbi:MAG TPA: FtsX-like permease family protein [Candidatus Sericytochromatia bacterium]|jgi:putative ABC transport system permease protein
MASIARKNLLQDIPRFLVAQAGIMFAVSLVTIQTGLQRGFSSSSSVLIDKSQADIWVTSEKMVHMELTLPLPFERVSQAQNVAGVDRAEAFIFDGKLWRDKNDNLGSVTMIGFDLDGKLFSPWNITKGSVKDLKQPFTILVDETSLNGLNLKGVGDSGKISSSSLKAQVAGLTNGVKSVVLGDLVFTSLENASTYSNPLADTTSTPKALSAKDPVTFVLVRAKPGENLPSLKKRLEAALPNTRAYTREEMSLQTQRYWQERSGIGFILGLGAVVGVIVGVVIVGQILYSSASDHIKEFGTLKAMGASDWIIYSVIVEQALWMALLGYIPGIALCLGVAAWTAATQSIVILITPASAATVLGLTVVMCVGSAIFAIQKVTRVDPAIVFKA